MAFVVSVHSGGGSMVEAADPMVAILVKDEATAKKVQKVASDWVDHHKDQYVRQECWATYFPVVELNSAPQVSSAEVRDQMGAKPHESVVDLGALLDKAYEENYG